MLSWRRFPGGHVLLVLGLAGYVALMSDIPALAGASPDTVGSLSIDAEPAGGSVYLDGRYVGRAPLTVGAVEAGDHRVRLVRDGYLEHSRVVTVGAGKATAVRIRLTSRGESQAPQAGRLRIVVIEGEDAVNIIQQGTAVAPLVEVRDRNDQPVAGVLVTFAIRRGPATFGNARTLTVRTDAAGRAAVTGLTLTGVGALQISATASFEGQTATTTISQANVMTAGAAAQGGGAAGAAASGAGGLSKVALLGIVGGAGAAAGVAAVALGKSDPAENTACVYTLSPPTQTVPAAGGTFSTALAASCAWSVASDAPWLSVSSSTSGSSNATISYAVQLNSASGSRTGRITVTGAGGSAALTVSQNGAPTASLSASASPNPAPFSGAPIIGPKCTGNPNTWFYNVTIVETAGVSVSLTRAVDVFDGSQANDLPVNIQVAAGGSRTFTLQWCGAPTSHTAQSTYSGTDAFGHAVSVTTPLVVMTAKPGF